MRDYHAVVSSQVPAGMQLQANLDRHELFDVWLAASLYGQCAVAIRSDDPAARQDFFEAGPGAQWAWLEEATAAPITDLVVGALLGDSP